MRLSSQRNHRTALAVLPAASFALVLCAFQGPVPTDIQLPGTQPLQVPALLNAGYCDNCHGGYNPAVEPAALWRGTMMAQATRDPLFWASLRIAEQDFGGSGDLCLRCHTPNGWIGGRSTPTNGSALAAGDEDGVSCHACHTLTNPDRSEHLGAQTAPFLANDEAVPATGYYGSGMYVLWNGNQRLGPYSDANAPHQTIQSSFHRESELCGTCHDVSNSAVGDLAHNFGAQLALAAGTYSGIPGSQVAGKAAFNNQPYAYGMVERTFSEHQAGALSTTLVSAYATLPAELRDGSIERAWQAATASTPSGNYVDGTPRSFSCQTCHMRPTTGKGASQNSAPVRADLPRHDFVGANSWMPDVLQWLDAQGRLLIGGGLTSAQISALTSGKAVALQNLSDAAELSVGPGSVRVTNLTGHKLITGYPEGRRMWLEVKWYDAGSQLLRTDGQYGPKSVTIGGQSAQVDTILDPSAHVWQAHFGMTQEWAAQILGLGHAPGLPLVFDDATGAVTHTLGWLAGQPAGTTLETFHFVLNNVLIEDNRIPPYGMRYDAARTRNVLPVPETLYGNPGPGGTYRYWDDVALAPPPGARTATIRLLYQATSWEYVRFLQLANDGTDPFLATVGQDMLDAWRATGMAAPVVMDTASWTNPIADFCFGDGSGTACPCGNAGAAGHGCANSVDANGGLLAATGLPSVGADTLVLAGSRMPNSSALYFQGTTRANGGAGTVFGDGLRCAGGSVIRLGTKLNVSSASQYPGAGDLAVSVRGAVAPGNVRTYQVWYRNAAAFCTGDTFNLTNGVEVVWGL